MSLTPKQERFVEEYLISLNASDAARKSGYSQKTAGSIAHENLKKPEIQRALAERKAELAESVAVTPELVMKELAAVGFSNLSDFLSWDQTGVCFKDSADIPPELLGAVAEVTEQTGKNGRTMRLKLHDKLKALGVLSDILGLRSEMAPKVQINVITGVPRRSHPPPKALPVVDVE